MYVLQLENVVKIVETGAKRDALLAQGYTDISPTEPKSGKEKTLKEPPV